MIKSIIQHLRFPFSILLMPVFFVALADLKVSIQNPTDIIVLFIILHLLVYPSSNAFNSLQDQDQGSIGLIKKPLPVAGELRWVTMLLDFVAIAISLSLSVTCCLGVFIYILVSRLYSYRSIRFKKYAIPGFLTVFIFQGYWIFWLVQSVANKYTMIDSLFMGFSASCLIGAIYPLSQIYQHQQDQADGVTSLSFKLGYRGTFLFSGIMYLLGSMCFAWNFLSNNQFQSLIIFSLFQSPVVVFFLWWFYQVWFDTSKANFQNTMRMNILSAVCMNTCFILLFLMQN